MDRTSCFVKPRNGDTRRPNIRVAGATVRRGGRVFKARSLRAAWYGFVALVLAASIWVVVRPLPAWWSAIERNATDERSAQSDERSDFARAPRPAPYFGAEARPATSKSAAGSGSSSRAVCSSCDLDLAVVAASSPAHLTKLSLRHLPSGEPSPYDGTGPPGPPPAVV
jgi:hypothetical protein